jgi:hypothetical protein
VKALGLLVLMVCPLVAAERTATSEKTFTVGGKPVLVIDNVWGGIEVTGADTNQVQVTVAEHWRADTDHLMEVARKEIKLDMSQDGDTVRLYVDGPFRCQGGVSFNGEPGYRADFDFKVRVPRQITIELKTIMGGDIRVRGTRGEFSIYHVNGEITADDIAGSGRIRTVNGRIHASFAENPRDATSFKTVNGEIEVTFQPGFAADVEMKTMHGDALTDFEYALAPMKPIAAGREGTRLVYRGGGTRLRFGSGGPEIRFETLNGPIRILKRGK